MNREQENIKSTIDALTQKLPGCLRGIKGTWRGLSGLCLMDIALAVFLALKGRLVWALIFAVFAALILVLSNYLLHTHVVNPIQGLSGTARRISDGSYGTLTDKLRDDEIGALTDTINEMSAKICAANKTQTEFISSVSHELRTPLTAITGWSETLLYDDAIQGDSRRGINIISKESGRLTNMVGELLEFSRIRDGRFKLEMETVDICAEVEDIVFTYEKLLREEGMKLSYAPTEEEISPITGDPRRLKQVIVNIIDNASKHGRGGDIEISVEQNAGCVIITVRDHGPGIPQNELPHVKERFYKGSSRERGNGIGLSICDEIVTRHGGTLEIRNAETGGTGVSVSLPIKVQK